MPDNRETCPLCGQPYDHRVEDTVFNDPDFRDSVEVCRRTVDETQEFYVHQASTGTLRMPNGREIGDDPTF